MTSERWTQIEELFHRALADDRPSRAALLSKACHDDPDLRTEVEKLLAGDDGAANTVEAIVHVELRSFAFPLAGKTLSHYQILEGLGGGGMGTVYRAQDVKLDRLVAIKFLPEESATDSSALRRFEREARSASALEHPNICPIYEFGEHDGRPFIVMPLFEGQTVEQLISAHRSKEPIQVLRLLDMATQVLKGLEAAHSHSIIHRDIKPANIFVTNDGRAKILDFGVAKLSDGYWAKEDHCEHVEADVDAVVPSADSLLSRGGAIIGTAAYMSPEQVRGEQLDTRTDIFSFGMVLYELATGKRAFTGVTWPELREAILGQTSKPARALNATLPTQLEDIVRKALEKDRLVRYQTAAEMRVELEDLQRRLAPKHLPRRWALGLALATVIFVASVFFLLKRQPRTISVAPEIKLRQLTTNSSENPVAGGAISPNGRYLAYIDAKGLHFKLVATGEVRTVPQPEQLNAPGDKWEIGAWFPDSTRFLVDAHSSLEDSNQWSSAAASIWIASVLGGPPRKIRDHAVVWSVSPDGSSISFGTNKGKLGEREIWMMGPSGEQARKFAEAKEDSAICCFGWLPDGKRYAYISTDASGDTLLSRNVKGGSATTLFHSSELAKVGDMVWLHDGRVVYSLQESDNRDVCNYWTMRLDLGSGKRIEEPRRLTNWPGFCVSSGTATKDDKQLVFAAWSNFYTSYVAEVESGGTRFTDIKHFTLEDSDDLIMDWAEEGRAVIVAQNRRDHYSLYKQRIDSDRLEPIVSSVAGGIVDYAVIAPGNKWIVAFIWPIVDGALLLRPSAPLTLVRIPFRGGAPETILQLSRPAPVSCARRPSGICVIFEQSETRKHMIVSVLDPGKGRGAELARFDLVRDIDVFVDNLLGAISSDGTRLAIARSPESPIEIYSLRGQLIKRIPSPTLGTVINLVWAPDQQGLYLTRKTGNGTELLHLDLRGHLQSLRQCVGPPCFSLPSPDNRHVSILENNRSMNMWMIEHF